MSHPRKGILDELRAGLPRSLEFTRRAFRMLPELNRPRILDVGCGRGDPTLELARLSGGTVIGLDVDADCLRELRSRAETEGLSDRIRTVQGSMARMEFAAGSFDMIWAEGAIQVIGFERGLAEWRPFLRSEGFLVVHEMAWLRPDPPEEIASHWQGRYPGIRTVEDYVDQIPRLGYEPMGHFPLPEDTWWANYYGPVQERIRDLRPDYADDPDSLAVLDREQVEVDLYRKYKRWYGSAFVVMRKAR